MSNRLNTARTFFAARENPYAGADMANAQRLGALLWGLVTLLIVLLMAATSPPNEAIGDAGWIVAGAIVLAGAGVVALLRRGKLITTWPRMLALSYAGVAAIGILQWLAGGVGSPYERMFLLPILFTAMLHPPRKTAAVMGFVALVLTAPIAYDGGGSDLAGSTFASFVVWCVLAVLGSVLMAGVRAGRVHAAAEEAKAREEARHDTLTGLLNRRAFDETLELEVERARRQNTPLAVAMIDIHSFKPINDGWGHAEGDRCLREVAQAIAGAIRRPDLCFRWGGDEFALILTDTTANDAAPLGGRLKGEVYGHCRRPDGEPMEIVFAVAALGEEMPAKELGEMAGLALTAGKAESKSPLDALENLEDRHF